MNTLFNQFTHFKYMQVTPHNTGNMRLSCRVRYYASFATWLVLAYIIPIRCFGFWNALWPCFVFQAAGSLCATYNIIINHVFEMAPTSPSRTASPGPRCPSRAPATTAPVTPCLGFPWL